MSINNLALLYKEQGKYDEALPLHEECLEKRRSILGNDHPNTLTSINNLVLLYKKQGKYDEALPLYEECLEKSRSILGNDHPDI